MANTRHLPGGEGEQPVGAAKRDVQAVKAEWQQINDDLTTNWDSLDTAGKVTALRAQAVFGNKVMRYLLIREFEM